MNTSLNAESTEWTRHGNLSCYYLTRFLVYSQDALKLPFILNCVLNAVLSVTAIVGNSAILWALTKSSSTLRSPSKALLFSLAMSDLGVGALVQPLYITYKAAEVNDNFRMFCVAGIGFHLSANVFSAVSFLTVTAIAIDRLLALHLKKGYNAAISLRRVAILLLLLWSATSLWVIAWIMSIKIYQIFNIASVFVCLLICASAYVTLQTRLRMLQNSMIASRFQTQDTESQVIFHVKENTPHLQLYRRSVVTMFYIYILLILCYVPYLSMFIVIEVTGRDSVKIACLSFAMTVLFANASLNPFLYCWRIQEIRREISKAAKNIFCRKWAEIKVKVYEQKTQNSALMNVNVHQSFSPRGSLMTARMIWVFAINISEYFKPELVFLSN